MKIIGADKQNMDAIRMALKLGFAFGALILVIYCAVTWSLPRMAAMNHWGPGLTD